MKLYLTSAVEIITKRKSATGEKKSKIGATRLQPGVKSKIENNEEASKSLGAAMHEMASSSDRRRERRKSRREKKKIMFG